jgi:hypothetical protein
MEHIRDMSRQATQFGVSLVLPKVHVNAALVNHN